MTSDREREDGPEDLRGLLRGAGMDGRLYSQSAVWAGAWTQPSLRQAPEVAFGLAKAAARRTMWRALVGEERDSRLACGDRRQDQRRERAAEHGVFPGAALEAV